MKDDLRLASALCLLVCACSSPAPVEKPTPKPTTAPETPDQREAYLEALDTSHNYKEREGDNYLYVSAISEDDRKAGAALGKVVMFRFLGEKDGIYRVQSVYDDGPAINYECAKPCRIIKAKLTNRVDRIPYDTDSLIGAAFEDALKGKMEVASADSAPKTKPTAAAASIPAAFIGEWNSDMTACGTGNSDSRLRIDRTRIRFYESDAEVKRVTVHNARAITVEGSFAGEGKTWNDTFQMVLSRSGDDLTISDYTRHRCP